MGAVFGMPAQLTDVQGALAKLTVPAPVMLTDADRAAIVADLTAQLAGLIPSAADIATAVLDEQHRRDAD
jgi:hypothetical protein